jgi:hypothetical protein
LLSISLAHLSPELLSFSIFCLRSSFFLVRPFATQPQTNLSSCRTPTASTTSSPPSSPTRTCPYPTSNSPRSEK